jgi:RNA polymerase sigma factor (sigma-70 family)
MSEQTQWTLIVRAQGEGLAARQALGQLVRAYQRTVRLLVCRQQLPRDMDVDDVVQDFFKGIVSRGDIYNIDPSKGRFRGWLKVAVRHHVSNARRRYFAQRYGHTKTDATDFSDAEHSETLASEACNPEALRELLRAEALDICDETIRRMMLRRRKPEQFKRLARLLPGRQLDLRPLRELASELGMTEGTLRDKMNDLRAEFRETLCKVVADGLCLPDGEDLLFNPLVRQELAELFDALGAPRDSNPPSEPGSGPFAASPLQGGAKSFAKRAQATSRAGKAKAECGERRPPKRPQRADTGTTTSEPSPGIVRH